MDIIKTKNGYVSGTIIGTPGKEVYIFRGIPFAAPPVGNLRWKPPQPAARWTGIRECTQYGLSSPQFGGAVPSTPQSEDCLYLNVMTPAKKASEKLPVMVWFHGGGFSNGTGNDPTFNRSQLANHGVVQVSVNHRLGTFGLMAHPLLSKESPKGISGNYMFLDIIESLKWVQENITAFGGDPENVTIFGQSGGGGKAIGMMASPLAKGLFHRCLIQSGGMAHGTPQEKLEAIGEKLFAVLRIKTLKEARAISWQKIVETTQAFAQELGVQMGMWDSAVDGWFLPDTTANIFNSGKYNAVPLIAGANLGELPTLAKKVRMLPCYMDLFKANSKRGFKGYAYVFDQVPAKWRAEGGVSPHGLELPYVFGDFDDSTQNIWPLLFTIECTFGVSSRNQGFTEADKKVSEAMEAMWSQFAKTGNPNVKGLVAWPAYETSNDQYLYLADPIKVKSGFSKVG
jgi:para-nitrobenzyl esterase